MSLVAMTGVDGAHQDSNPLKILAVHRYYWPDAPPYASILQRIVGRWRQDGHHVEVLSAQPSYKSGLDNKSYPKREVINGVPVERLNLPNEAGRPVVRICNAIRLGASLLFRAVMRRYDMIMISTAPPILGGLAAALAARLSGARFIYHCMDIHPEVGRVSGEFSYPLVFGLLRKLDSWSCRQADVVVVLSRDMQNTLRSRPGGERIRIEVLNNFSLPSEEPVPNELSFDIRQAQLNVIFAGNIGRFQGLDTVVEAMGRLKGRDDIQFILMGDGVAKPGLQAQAQENGANIRFVGHQPVEMAKAAMQHADVGFVSLIPELYRYAYPSKTMTYLEQGCPLIVAVEAESELASDVLNQGYGYCVPVGDSEALAELLIRLAHDPGWKQDKREHAFRKASRDFSEPLILDKWSALVCTEDTMARDWGESNAHREAGFLRNKQ